MEKVTKTDLLNKEIKQETEKDKEQMQLELKEIKPIFQIITDLVKAVAYNTSFDEKNNINVIHILETIVETDKDPMYKLKIYDKDIFQNNVLLYQSLKKEYMAFTYRFFSIYFPNNKKLLYKPYILFTKILPNIPVYNYRFNTIKLGLISLLELLFRTMDVNSIKDLYDSIKITYFALNPHLKDRMFSEEIEQEKLLIQPLKESFRKEIKTQEIAINITESDKTPIEELTDISSSILYLQKKRNKEFTFSDIDNLLDEMINEINSNNSTDYNEIVSNNEDYKRLVSYENNTTLLVLKHYLHPNGILKTLEKEFQFPHVIPEDIDTLFFTKGGFIQTLYKDVMLSSFIQHFFDTNEHGMKCKDAYNHFKMLLENEDTIYNFFKDSVHLVLLPVGIKGITTRYLNIFINKGDYTFNNVSKENKQIFQVAFFLLILIQETFNLLMIVTQISGQSVNELGLTLQKYIFGEDKICNITIELAKIMVNKENWNTVDNSIFAKYYVKEPTCGEYIHFMSYDSCEDYNWCASHFP